MPNLKISPDKAILLLNGRIDEIKKIGQDGQGTGYYDVIGWCSKTYSVIDEIYPADDFHPEEIRSIGLPACSCNSQTVVPMLFEAYHARLQEYIDEIRRSMESPA
jgi:hypothetical protein